MKKAPLFTALGAFALILAACASNNQAGFGNGGGSGSSSGFGGSNGSSFRNSALTADAKLALGTIKLEGTAQAVDPQTAAKLLPLWQLMVQLHSSSSTAPQEVAATQAAIQAAMKPAQLSTINGMTLSTADLFSLLQSEAQSSGSSNRGTGGFGGGGFSGRNGGNGGGRVFFVGPGGPGGFGGGPGGGFGGGFGGGENRTGNGSSSSSQLTPEQQAQAAQARENAISSLVENQLIRLLETKLGTGPG